MTTIAFESTENNPWGTFVLSLKGEKYHFPCYLPTREVFNFDPDLLIRLKCAALVVLTPLVSLLRSIYWFAKSIFLAFAEIFHYLDGQDLDWSSAKESAEDSVRAITYGSTMCINALEGIVFPYDGRMKYGHTERELNRHTDGPHRDKLYLAFCFQRIAMMPEKYLEQIDQVEAQLKRYMNRVFELSDAIYTCSFGKIIKELGLNLTSS